MGGRATASQVAVAFTAFSVAACAILFAGRAPSGVELAGIDFASLEAEAATSLPGGGGQARTQDLADTGAFGSAPPSRRGVVYGNDASGDDVELDPISSSSGARTQALYDTAGLNAGGGLITPMQRATVCFALLRRRAACVEVRCHFQCFASAACIV